MSIQSISNFWGRLRKNTDGVRSDLLFAVSLSNLLAVKDWAFLDWALRSNYPQYPLRLGDGLFFLTLIGILSTGFFLLLRMSQRRGYGRAALMFAFSLLLLLPINFLRVHYNASVLYPIISMKWWVDHIGKPACVVLVIGLALGLIAAFRRYPNSYSRLIRGFVLCGFPFVFLTFGSVGLEYIKQIGHERTTHWENTDKMHATSPLRVVWLVFDEWDYSLTFVNRAETLFLPEIDQLRRESFFATQAYSPHIHTHASIPAYALAQKLTEFCRRSDNDIDVRTNVLKSRVRLSEQETVFSRLADLGKSVSVTGWYHPYCDMLPAKKFATCDTEMYYEYGQPGKLGARLGSVMSRIWNPFEKAPPAHLNSYDNLRELALRRSSDENLDFVYAHLSVPHLPGIYRRRIGKVVRDRPQHDDRDEKDIYFSNLALASRTLGEIISEMKLKGVWNQTILLVTSDHALHGWRWDGDTPRDSRVPFLVRIPGVPASEFSKPFNTVISGLLLEELLLGKTKPKDFAHRIGELTRNEPYHTTTPEDSCPVPASGITSSK